MCGSATKCKKFSGRSKTVRTADACIRLRMLSFVYSHPVYLCCSVLPVMVNKDFHLWRVQRSQLFKLFSAYYYQFWALLPIRWQFMHTNIFTCQFLCAQLPLSSVNSNLKFDVTPVSCMWSDFNQKQHINAEHPAKQKDKIWRKHFQALLSNHIFRVEPF